MILRRGLDPEKGMDPGCFLFVRAGWGMMDHGWRQDSGEETNPLPGAVPRIPLDVIFGASRCGGR